MLTTDALYYKPLLPVITIKNTANNATQYTYNSFTDTGTTDKVLYCSVNLSQNTHGEFTIQFEDQNKSLESTVTVGSRVQIDCGKQSTSLTRLISGIVRKKGYARGANNKVLYTIQGTSTGIRLNELITYVVSEATKLNDGVTPDITDISRKADTLLANSLTGLTADGILSIANLAANSDVETFIASISVEFGQLQDAVNYIENQSGGEVVVDTNDLVNFRHEIKNNLFGRGFTIKNNNDNRANDDADDTMYMIGKNWSYEDEFYESSGYANRIYSILQPEPRPASVEDLGFTTEDGFQFISSGSEAAVKFRPTHCRFVPLDIYIVGAAYNSVAGGTPFGWWARICKDSGGVPQNTAGIVVNILFNPLNWTNPKPTTDAENYHLANMTKFHDTSTVLLSPQEFFLDTTKDYWFIMSNKNATASDKFDWGTNQKIADNTGYAFRHLSTFSTDSAGGANWAQIPASAGMGTFAADRYRSTSFSVYDPKAVQAIQSGLTGGQYIDSIAQDANIQIKTRYSMARHLISQLYTKSRSRTTYNFSAVMAPNIPPFPGDPIIINDSVLGLSTTGNPIALTTCGDMTYQWGNMVTGSYEAPTKLNIQAIATHPRYR